MKRIGLKLLNLNPVKDRGDLNKMMPWICNDFNNRPHISLNGLTPNESYENVVLDSESLKELKKIASQNRKMYNFKNRCTTCKDEVLKQTGIQMSYLPI